MNSKKINILIIDDDIEFCFLCAQNLPKISDIYNCEIATDGMQALSMIKAKQYDLLILDAIMPVMDGLGVLSELSKLKLIYTPKILAITSSDINYISKVMLDNGADYFMPKPQSINELADRLQYIILSPLFNKKPKDCAANYALGSKNDDEIFAMLMLKKIISKKVLEYGIPAYLIGYNYSVSLLYHLIVLKHSNPTLLQVYDIIAKEYNTNAKCIENAINMVMKVALKNNTPALNSVLEIANLYGANNFSNNKFFSLLLFDIEQSLLSFVR